ncbi:MAG: hypothetical protein ABH869_03560 [Candidatus Omnitrophota bacterium]
MTKHTITRRQKDISKLMREKKEAYSSKLKALKRKLVKKAK